MDCLAATPGEARPNLPLWLSVTKPASPVSPALGYERLANTSSRRLTTSRYDSRLARHETSGPEAIVSTDAFSRAEDRCLAATGTAAAQPPGNEAATDATQAQRHPGHPGGGTSQTKTRRRMNGAPGPMMGGLLKNAGGDVEAKIATDDSLPSLGDVEEDDIEEELDVFMNSVDVILAEDEEIHYTLLRAGLIRCGIGESRIHRAHDGFKAMELLLELQTPMEVKRPLMMLLDVCMPGMDGRECASKVVEMTSQKLLARAPYIIACSATVQTSVSDAHSCFHMALPKNAFFPLRPAEGSDVSRVLNGFRRWWTQSLSEKLRLQDTFDISSCDCLVADETPIWCETLSCMLQNSGFSAERVHAVSKMEEVIPTVQKLCEKNEPKRPRDFPLLVFLSQQSSVMSGSDCATALLDVCKTKKL